MTLITNGYDPRRGSFEISKGMSTLIIATGIILSQIESMLEHYFESIGVEYAPIPPLDKSLCQLVERREACMYRLLSIRN